MQAAIKAVMALELEALQFESGTSAEKQASAYLARHDDFGDLQKVCHRFVAKVLTEQQEKLF
jgi:hypothetical protein